MKHILVASIVFCCLTGGATSQVISQAAEKEKAFGLGKLVFECVLGGCQIFVAELLTDSPRSGEVVEVKVVEGLLGIGSDAGTLKLPYLAPHTNRKYELDLALAWMYVKFSRGALVTVVLPRERMRSVRAGDPAFTTTDDHASAIIRSLAEEVGRSMAPSYSASSAVDSLSRVNNPALAGFLFAYLTERTSINHPEVASPLLVKLLGSASVPDIVRELVTVSIVGDYHRLAQADRMAMVGQLAEIAQKQNIHAAAAALHGLGRIAGFDHSTWKYLTPLTLSATAGVYRNLRDKGLISKTESLEIGLAGSQDPLR